VLAKTVQLYSFFKHKSSVETLESVATLVAVAHADDGTDRCMDLGALLRALRRRADLSQRQLAERAGVPASTVARIESGRAVDPRFRTVERLVRAAGRDLAVGGPLEDGRQRLANEAEDGRQRLASEAEYAHEAKHAKDAKHAEEAEEGIRDEAGRRYPAHLDVRAVRSAKDWSGAWWAYWYDLPRERWPVRAPAFTYDLDRPRRDRRRRREEMREQVSVRRAVDGPPNGWHLVAEGPDGALVGELHAYLRRSGEDAGYEVVLACIEVLPQWRRLGIGRRLVDGLRAEVTRAGVSTVLTLVEDGVLIQFLIRCGFTDEWRRPSRLTLTLPS
jgi:transcriptional regulator with XRE-family HTH domain